MKKTIIAFIVILIAVASILAMLGAGGEYAAERLFYRAMKLNSGIVVNPDVAPPGLLASVETSLQNIRERYPKANITKTASIALVEFYTAHKQYDKALSMIDTISITYKNDITIISTAQFMRGVIYERQNQWPMALAAFNVLRDKYPNTQLGIQIPLYIAKYYDVKGMEEEAGKAYAEAEAFYEKLERENSGTMLGYVASNMLTQAFINSRNYEKAGERVEYSINTYPSDVTFAQLLPAVEAIYIQKLNKPEKALEIYKNIKSKTRDPKLIKFLDKKIPVIENKK